MKLIKDSFDFTEYMAELDQIGIAGHPYPFQHMNEPEDFPCVVETLIDDDKPGAVVMVHVFFGPDDAALLAGITVKADPVYSEEHDKK